MKRRTIKTVILIIVAAFLAYNSVFVKSLDEVRAAGASGFDARGYAEEFWQKHLMPSADGAVLADSLLFKIKENAGQAFAQYGKSLGIGNLKYFLVKGRATVKNVEEDRIEIQFAAIPPSQKTFLETEYVYGNAVRDASGKVSISDFDNTADLNNVSEKINEKIRQQVLKPFLSRVKKGDEIAFAAAVELNSQYPLAREIEFIPISLQIKQ